MAPMMMKLKLVAIAFGVAQAVTQICADNAAYDGTIKPVSMGGVATCDMATGAVPPFTASAASCAANLTMGGSTMRASMVMGAYAACCKTGGDVCSQYSLNPCATPSDWNPKLTMSGGGDTMGCAHLASTSSAMTASAASCAVSVQVGGSSLKTVVVTAMLANGGCCGATGKSACKAFESNANPCADKTKYMPKNTIDGDAKGTPCSTAMATMEAFVPDKVTCAVSVTVDGKALTRTMAFGGVAPTCCSDKVSICANAGAAKAAVTPTGTKAAGTDVASGAAGASVAKIFFAIVALAPQMLA